MTEIKEIQITTIGEPAQIKLIKTAKGYNWELNLHGETLASCMEKIKTADDTMKERYGVVVL